MILFYSDGRLGNQIFQLAFIREIVKPGEKVVTFNLGNVLNVFDVDLKVRNTEIKNKLWKFISRKMFIYILEILSALKLSSIIYEDRKAVVYKKQIGLFPSVTYIRTGFFQSEKFFNRESFLQNVKLKKVFLERAYSFLKVLPNNSTKVFIHVRRGDYLTEIYEGVRGINLPMDYYVKAINIVKNKINNPYFVIMSDDYNFVSEAFKDLENKVISKENYAVDLAVMASCDGGIISNSSYSWWGAFLLHNKNMVIMPKYWYGWKNKKQSHQGIELSFADVLEF